MNYEYFLFRFTSAQYRDLILDGGPWIVDDAMLALEPWTPTFIPSPHRLPALSCGCGCLPSLGVLAPTNSPIDHHCGWEVHSNG